MENKISEKKMVDVLIETFKQLAKDGENNGIHFYAFFRDYLIRRGEYYDEWEIYRAALISLVEKGVLRFVGGGIYITDEYFPKLRSQ